MGQGLPASWYVPGLMRMVVPGEALSTAAWMDCPSCTTIGGDANAAPGRAIVAATASATADPANSSFPRICVPPAFQAGIHACSAHSYADAVDRATGAFRDLEGIRPDGTK